MEKTRKCLWCGKKTKNKKFCSRKCEFKYFKKHKIGLYDLKIRKKGLETLKRLKKGIYDSKIRKKAREKCKKLKKGIYGLTKEDHIRNAKKANITNKKNKTSFCYDKELQSKAGKKSAIINKKNKTGIFNPKIIKKRLETCKRLKLGSCYNSEIHNKICKKGGLVSAKVRREKKPYYFHKIPFDSNFEKEIGMNITYQLKIKLKEGVNCHIRIGGKEFDFKIKRCIIEPHIINHFFNKYYKNDKDYYLKRRKILDKNGYKKYKLIVIK